VRSAAMNKKRMIKTPKLVIAVKESKTVESKILRESQDLIILKTLKSLNALSTDKLEEDPAGMTSST
jgi:hypothetical protein